MNFLNNIKTAEHIEAERIEALAVSARAKRDRLIAETDYLVMPDYPDQPEGLSEYRQALRDVPEQTGFPESIEWPEKP